MSTATATATDFYAKIRSCPEVDAYFRLAKGTCRRAVIAGLLKSTSRQARGVTCHYVEPRDAARIWGAL